MATVDGLTKARMLAIEAASVVSGAVNPGTGHLILTTHDGTVIDAGYVFGTISAASDTVAGIVELATNTEVATGTDTVRAVTPAGLASVLSGKQAADSDLTVIAAIAPTNDDVIQRKAGAWTNRSIAQLGTDLAVSSLQPQDSDLTAIAAISPANDDVIQRKAGAWTNRTIAQLGTDLSASSLQPKDSDLTTIAGLTPAANDVMQFKSSAWANRTMTQFKTDLAIAESDVTNLTTDLAAKAPLASPAFTGKASFVASVHTPVAVALSAGHAAIDANAGDIFDISATANFTLDNPTNPTNGQVIHLRITQDATGSRIITLGSAWNAGPNTITLTTTANKRDHLIAQYHSGSTKWDITGFQKGY